MRFSPQTIAGAPDCRRVLLITAVALITGFSSPKAFGQGTAAVNGTIRDSSGGIIPAARVGLINAGTSVRQNTLSTDTGRYVFLNVLPGRYTLEVTKEGFAPTTQRESTLEVDQTATFDSPSLPPPTVVALNRTA